MNHDEEFIKVLRHDLHKIQITGALPHKIAMPNKQAREADAFAAWLGRRFLPNRFEKSLYRQSLIFPLRNYQNPRTLENLHKSEVEDLFNQLDPMKLHASILQSKLLNLYCEARNYPYSSLKYHILLTCALFYNLKNSFHLNQLYLCEDLSVDSPFQVIYQDEERIWSIMPGHKADGLSRIWPKFHHTWDYRVKLSIGGDHRILAGILSSIGSWTTALATMEDFQEFVRNSNAIGSSTQSTQLALPRFTKKPVSS